MIHTMIVTLCQRSRQITGTILDTRWDNYRALLETVMYGITLYQTTHNTQRVDIIISNLNPIIYQSGAEDICVKSTNTISYFDISTLLLKIMKHCYLPMRSTSELRFLGKGSMALLALSSYSMI